MKNINKKVFKKNFYNYKSLAVVLSFIILLLLSLKSNYFLFPLFLIIIIIVMSIISYFNEIKFLKKVYSYKNGLKKFPYKPYSINKKDFIEIINNYGLPLTYIKIKNIFAIEVVKQDDNYTCYIDEYEFNSLEEFLNYEIDNTKLTSLNKIKILAFDNGEPEEISTL